MYRGAPSSDKIVSSQTGALPFDSISARALARGFVDVNRYKSAKHPQEIAVHISAKASLSRKPSAVCINLNNARDVPCELISFRFIDDEKQTEKLPTRFECGEYVIASFRTLFSAFKIK